MVHRRESLFATMTSNPGGVAYFSKVPHNCVVALGPRVQSSGAIEAQLIRYGHVTGVRDMPLRHPVYAQVEFDSDQREWVAGLVSFTGT
jgi:hypothetical protein